jgi:SAM-dependent methyltransferase
MEGLKLDSPASAPSPYQAPELYDVLFGAAVGDDLAFWLEESRAARGPVLEVGCGTGRVLLHLAAAGIDVDGIDDSRPMLERLRLKAEQRGLRVTAREADMRDFTLPRRYGLVICPFNGFAHCQTIEDQVRALRCWREHLEPGGRVVLHMSYPGAAYWLEPDGEPVLEIEVAHPDTGHPVRLYDTRSKDLVGQFQASRIEIVLLDEAGVTVASHRFQTRQRWVYRFELELLLRSAGFSRCEILGGYDRRPLERDTDQMLAFGWRD